MKARKNQLEWGLKPISHHRRRSQGRVREREEGTRQQVRSQ
jgi:hypothetical protein